MDTAVSPPQSRPSSRQPGRVRRIALVGGRVMVPEGPVEAGIVIEDGRIAALEAGGDVDAEIDVDGLLLLPGIIDLHGDAFERALQPRQGVSFPAAQALAECDAWCLAAGITTPFISITDSFEPGLRSRDTLRRLLGLLGGRARTATDMRVHVRHEVCQIDDHQELVEWLETGRIDLLSTADHLPGPGQPARQARFAASLARRSGLDRDEMEGLVAEAASHRETGRRQEADLCARARRLGIPLASHDDASEEEVAASRMRGCTICEFPANLAAAMRARTLGMAVLLGGPNYVRGGSHLGLMGVGEALQAGAVDALCSDYHFPSLFHAPFAMAERGHLPLPQAWELVSAAPARLAGLESKGRLAVGCDADLLLVDDRPGSPRLRGVWVGGCEVARFT